MHATTILAASSALLTGVLAHPHVELSPQLAARNSGLSKRCEASVAAMNKKRYAKREEKKQLAQRDANATYQITTEAPYYDTIQNSTCVLSEEATEGPYIWPQSQTLRQDIREDQEGIPMILDIGVLDTETCEPLSDVLVDIWHCNATGSYSSFTGRDPNTPFAQLVSELNMTIGPGLDLHTDATTWLRGMWPTDSEGVTEFTTIVPGFYVERAIHIHVQVHENWVLQGNGTIASSTTVSTTQIGINETMSEVLMAQQPYVSHTEITRTTNDVDTVFENYGASNGWDYDISIVPMDGEDVTNGVIGYITLGVDSATKKKMKRDMSQQAVASS